MKKLFVLLLSGLVLTYGAISASAEGSPSSVPDPDNSGIGGGNGENGGQNTGNGSSDTGSNGTGSGSTGSGSSSTSGTSSSSGSTTSPKTGVAGTYAVLMAGAALAFGGVAAGAKKKLDK